MGRFQNRVSIVTGAASGIGLATAERLVAEGGNVLLTDLNEEAGSEAAQRLGAAARFRAHDAAVGGGLGVRDGGLPEPFRSAGRSREQCRGRLSRRAVFAGGGDAGGVAARQRGKRRRRHAGLQARHPGHEAVRRRAPSSISPRSPRRWLPRWRSPTAPARRRWCN